MQSSLDKLLERDYLRQAVSDTVWDVLKALFLMVLGALIYALWSQ